MACNKKFPTKNKYKNGAYQISSRPSDQCWCDINPILLCQIFNRPFIKFGKQIGDGWKIQSRRPGGAGKMRKEQKREGREEEEERREEGGGEGGTQEGEGEGERRRRRRSCIMQFGSIILILWPHFDFWGWACYTMALAFATWKSPVKKGAKLAVSPKPKIMIISLGPFGKKTESWFPHENCTLKVLYTSSGHLTAPGCSGPVWLLSVHHIPVPI